MSPDEVPMTQCERCKQMLWGGSHWHCGKCDSAEVTSMYGHFHSGEYVLNKWVSTEGHHKCDEGACEDALKKALRL